MSSIKLISYLKQPCAVLLLSLAVIVQFMLVVYYPFQITNHPPPTTSAHDDGLNPDARSAIKRAKTSRCKQELRQFVLADRERAWTQFERACPSDTKGSVRVTRLGCSAGLASPERESLFVTIDDKVADSDSCNELCFSYGHVYGGFNSANKKCLCADDLSSELPLAEGPDCQRSDARPLEWFKVNNGIHYPSKQNLTEAGTKQHNRIAFLLSLNGRSLLQVLRLLKNIYSEKHFYYIHVDSRQQYLHNKLEPLRRAHKNIILARERLETIWGGTALLTMTLNAMKDLSGLHWDILINLSESDFPIKTLGELQEYLSSQSRHSLYLKSHNMKGYKFIKKQGLDYNFYQCEGRVWRLGRRQLPRGIVYSGGSDWFGLPKGLCQYIIDNQDRPNSLVNSLLGLYNFTLLPAESFFHTLVMNSEFCDKFVDNNLRITNWRRKQGCKCQHKNTVDWCGCSPLIYRWSDLNKLEQTRSSEWLFFSRKFDPTISSTIIGTVESRLLNKAPTEEGKLDTRYWMNVYEWPESLDRGSYKVFGEFVMSQVKQPTDGRELKSIDLHFNEDRFVGIVYKLCDHELSCQQLLVERKVAAHLGEFNQSCFKSGVRQLKAIEVNHGFDTGERVFRNFMPLDPTSDIAVYHEWLVVQESNGTIRSGGHELLFKWVAPNDEVALIQQVKLKTSAKPTRLSLVHRLTLKKPLPSGMWKLLINDGKRDCLEYIFLILADIPPSHVTQSQFDQLYQVTQTCTSQARVSEDSSDECHNHSWSLTSRNEWMEAHKL